jgi:hypothetical protein
MNRRAALTLGLVVWLAGPAAAQITRTVTVHTQTSTGQLMWGGLGWLYGLGTKDALDEGLLTGLVHPGYTSQRPPGGQQHPDGDALEVAEQFQRAGGRGIGLYLQDWYAPWPYPAVALADYLKVADEVAARVAADPRRAFFHYVPFNEPDWIWYSASGPKFEEFLAAWKTVVLRLRAADPGARVAGPNFASYHATAMKRFLEFARDNEVVPDLLTWHELDGSLFRSWYDHYDDARRAEASLGLPAREIFINEYARQKGDLGVPGNLIQYLARFETSKVYGGLAFWTGTGTLNDLVANDNADQHRRGTSLNQPDGAWYLYRWYGQLQGYTVAVDLPNRNGPLQALAARHGANVEVLFGGAYEPGDLTDVRLVLTGVAPTLWYQVWEAASSGTRTAPEPPLLAQGVLVAAAGTATLDLPGCRGSSAYRVRFSPTPP